MNRRTYLKSIAAAGSALRLSKAQAKEKPKPIQLFVEMQVDPAREKELLDNFHNIFFPEAKKHPGYISLRLLKMRQVIQGQAQWANYRFELVFQSEELRQKWINSPEHQRVWPTLERTMTDQKTYPVVLYDEA